MECIVKKVATLLNSVRIDMKFKTNLYNVGAKHVRLWVAAKVFMHGLSEMYASKKDS